MTHVLYELDVRLRGIEPPIWRTIEVPGTATLEELHLAIQIAMGWTNSHLHQFKIGKKAYGMADLDGAEEMQLEDERAYRLQDLVRARGSFVYEYDFGDSWEHRIAVNKVEVVAKPPRPRCIAGARACPPEDCGGTGGYENLLAALADPTHEEHATSVSWSGGFEPERFELPKKGLELRAEMAELQAIAEGDEPAGDNGPIANLPRALVQAVLALEPMDRASLGALIVGSLADELLDERQRVPARGTRRRGRS